MAPRPYQMASQQTQRANAQSDPEGTGVWTPNWDDDNTPPPNRPDSDRDPWQQSDQPTSRYDVAPPSPRAPQHRDSGDEPTVFIPRRPEGPEPRLYTHREPDPPNLYRPEEVQLADEDLDEQSRRRKRVWRRVRRACLALALLFFLGPIIAFLLGYLMWDVPNAAVLGASQQNQVVTVYYSDGQTELAKIVPQDENRINVPLEQVPKHVQDAVLAAEDRSFWSNPGFDPVGIGRAVWKQATGGKGGGSTVTQQYIKVATQEDDYSIRRKFRELVLSTKISQQYSKEDILENYLNIVYLGRQAYGIQAASQAYFGKDVAKLSVSEGALLAGMIQSPSRSDPAKNLPRAEARWNFVLDGMVSQGWLDATQRSTEKFSPTIPLDQVRAGTVTDSRLHIQTKAIAELEAAGFDTATVHEYGGKIITTIDPRAQQAAVEAVNTEMGDEPPNLRTALVAIDPKSGAVKAYFGGHEGVGLDLADEPFQPGSSFKPFVMLAALEQGKGLGDMYDGGSPLKIGGATFNNSESSNYSSLSLKKAMTYSVNTAFVKLAHEVGPTNVAAAAHKAGIPESVDGKRTLVNDDGSPPSLAIALGALPVRPIDMASGYATFAANGVKREPFLVTEFINAEGELIYKHADSASVDAFDSNDGERNVQLACNVTESLDDVATYSKFALKGNRESAAKTGTAQYNDPGGQKTNFNSAAWTVGYTPSISAAVWVGDPTYAPIKTRTGKNIFGATLPGPIWKAFMDAYLEPTKPTDDKFPKCEPLGRDEVTRTAAPPPPTARTTTPPSTTAETTTRTSRPSDTRPTRPTRTTRPGLTTPTCWPTCPPSTSTRDG